MPYINISSGNIHYRSYGAGEPLVLLHANPGDGRDYDSVVPKLAQSYRVIVLDWPGYGKSDIPNEPRQVSVIFYYQAFVEFLDALGIEYCYLIGNSVGGCVAARFAAEHPDRALGMVLVSPDGFTEHNVFTRMFCRIQASRFSLPPKLFARLYLKCVTPTTRSMLKRAATFQSTPQRRILSRALWRSFVTSDGDLRLLARAISSPTLLLFGKYDRAISAYRDGRVAARCIPHARYMVLPCGHAAFAELPDQFLEHVTGFLRALSHRIGAREVS